VKNIFSPSRKQQNTGKEGKANHIHNRSSCVKKKHTDFQQRHLDMFAPLLTYAESEI
jgi:hypothetical protein